MTNVVLNFPAWTSSVLLYLFQVWYLQPALCSLLHVLWCLHRAPIQAEPSWQSHGSWGLTGIVSGRTHSVTKPGLNSAERLLHWGCGSAQLHSFPWDNAVGLEHNKGKNVCSAFCWKAASAQGLDLFLNGKVRNKQPFKSLSSLSTLILLVVNYLWPADILSCKCSSVFKTVLRKSPILSKASFCPRKAYMCPDNCEEFGFCLNICDKLHCCYRLVVKI